jgi:uncharacterized membrane protein YiaA
MSDISLNNLDTFLLYCLIVAVVLIVGLVFILVGNFNRKGFLKKTGYTLLVLALLATIPVFLDWL